MARLSPPFLEQPHLTNHHASVDGLDHVVDGEQAHLNGRQGLHLHTGLARHANGCGAANRGGLFHVLKSHRDPGNGQGVTQRDEITGLLGGLYGGDSRDAKHVALVSQTRLNLSERLRSHLDDPSSNCFSSGVRLEGDIHHVGLACRIEMIQFLCHLLIIALLSSAVTPAWAQQTGSPRPLSDITASLPALGEAAVDELSPAAERRLGEQVFSQIQAAGMVHDDPEATDYLAAQASRLVQAAQARGDLAAGGLKAEDFHFFWVKEDSINAFALPGGWIGIHTGLMTRAANEAELMSVVAHEIAHVTQRHIARQMGQSRQSMAVFLATAILAAAAASKSGDAAMGLMSLGETLALRSQLAFSRDAEREADRLGFSLLQASGFDPLAMSSLFEKLSQAGRYYDDAAPLWLRTHPLSSERLSDAQLRMSQTPMASTTRPSEDSLEFLFIRARLLAQSGRDLDRTRAIRTRLRAQLDQAVLPRDQAVAWYGLAWAELALKSPDDATASLQRARVSLVGTSSAAIAAPLFGRLEQTIAHERGQFESAVAISQPGDDLWSRSVSARGIARQRADALLSLGRYKAAVDALIQVTRRWPDDPQAWTVLAKAYAGDRRPAMAHWATAESYALVGAYGAAIEQINLARRADGADFQALSQMDARLAKLRAALKAQEPSEKRPSSDR